jgi:hypothetical protein
MFFMTSTVRVVRENREFKFDFEYRYQQQVMFMHCDRKKHEGKRRHVAKHLKLGGVGGLYLKFELQLKSNKIFIAFPDSRIPGFPYSPIPGFPDSRIPRSLF